MTARWGCGCERLDPYGMGGMSASEVFEHCASHFVGPQVAAEELMLRHRQCDPCRRRSERRQVFAFAGVSLLLAAAGVIAYAVR